MTDKSFTAWAESYNQAAASGTEPMWPSETVVRLFRGDYIPGLSKDYAGKKLLDVSVGNGNNLVFFASLGLELYGTEILPEICTAAAARMAKHGVNVDMRAGVNQSLPFDDDTFDFLTSWNVLHYENTEADIIAAIAEYRRVLKPGGRVIVSTTGPEHMILKDAKTLGNHRYQIQRDDDFRKDEIFFYFDSANYLKHYFETEFDEVLVGRTHDFLLTNTLDWFIVSGVKS